MTMTTILLSLLVLASGASPMKSDKAAAPAPAKPAAEPAIEMSIPAPCADVWKDVYEGANASWKVTVLAPRAEDEKLPEPEQLKAFVLSVPGLEDAIATFDSADQDVFYVRARTQPLPKLVKSYPTVDPKIVRKAKLQACKEAAAK